jgi:type I restriction enzyme, S subunit
MNAERLLTQYERIADAPDAIPRLRRFVLDLAVRGKLVPQEPSDEPASELLKRIAAEKARLAKAGQVRAAKTIQALSDVPFPLPTNWHWSQIAEIGILSPRNDAPDDLRASFVPMPLIAAEYGVANGHEVRPWGEIKKGYTHFAEGDVGLAKITPCFENGKSTVFRNLTGGIGGGTTELHIVRPLFVDQNYILIFLKSPDFIETGIPKMTGNAGQKRVPFEYFAYSPFPLPPLAEQRRIVTKVDELMGLCDRLEAARADREATRDRLTAASLARLNAPDPDTFQDDARFVLDALPALIARPDQIKQLRQTILNLAVRGKLVPQNASDEPASELLKRIGSGWSEVVADLPKETDRSDETDGLISGLPRGWERVLVEHCFNVSGGIQKTPARTPRNNAFPYLGVSNVYRGRLDLTKIKRFELVEGELEKYRLEPEDILVVEGNGSVTEIGRCAVWRGEIENCVHQNHLIRCRPRLANLTPYAALYLNSPDGVAEMKRLAITSAGLYSLSVGKIRKIPFSFPPLAEQQRIVAKVDELMALCDRLEASLTTADDTRSRLLEALLAEALAPAGLVDREAAE